MHQKKNDIAVVGMALRVPGASTISRFWGNILAGRDSLSRHDLDKLRKMGCSCEKMREPSFIPVSAEIEDAERSDCSLFDISDFEANLTDPGHKMFLECVWESMEDAGLFPGEKTIRTGVFAGSESDYREFNLKEVEKQDVERTLSIQLRIGSSPDFMPTRVSHKFGFNGPSYSILAACATSLYATHAAVQSLRQGECDYAVAGGSTIIGNTRKGYRSSIEGLFSPEGRLRPFDAAADGTIFGIGVGTVLLRRLEDAVADGSQIYAVIRGTATSNDGNPVGKESFAAPSPEGQTATITAALEDAGVGGDTIGLVEAHGTATLAGDPTEAASLGSVYRQYTEETGYCSLSSVKANIGHPRAAAGVAGMIKACLALKHKTLPPATNFETPNPRLNLDASPFFIHTDPLPWETGKHPRRAAVSSFGFGGSNAHVVLEEYLPKSDPEPASCDGPQLIVLSAQSEAALNRRQTDLAGHLEMHSELSLHDVAYTLQCGRAGMPHRRCFYVDEPSFMRSGLFHAKADVAAVAEEQNRKVAFLFPGQGSQSPGMAWGLYEGEPVYREVVDRCAELLKPLLNKDIREIIQSGEGMTLEEADALLRQTANAQPALFVVEYAMARLYMAWGLQPSVMLGHSVGELVAACMAGIFSVEDGLKIVAARSRLMADCDPGAMLGVFLSHEELSKILPEGIEISAVNGPQLAAVSGTIPAIDAFFESLEKQGIGARKLATSHAFHSWMMDKALPAFREVLESVELHAPTIPIVSNVTGKLMTDQEATDPCYWSDHIRHAVMFSPSLELLLSYENPVCLEVGPGSTLTNLVSRQAPDATVVSALQVNSVDDKRSARLALATVWTNGGTVDWESTYQGLPVQKVRLPVYPFQRHRHYIEPGETGSGDDLPLNLYERGWALEELDNGEPERDGRPWLIFADDCGLSDGLIERLTKEGADITVLRQGGSFRESSEKDYTIRPDSKDDYSAVLKKMKDCRADSKPHVVQLWSVTGSDAEHNSVAAFTRSSLLMFSAMNAFIMAAHEAAWCDGLDIVLVVDGWMQMPEEEVPVHAEKSTIQGPLFNIPLEFSGVTVRAVDVVEISEAGAAEWLVSSLYDEVLTDECSGTVLLRDSGRYLYGLYPVQNLPASRICLRDNGVVLITGGVGDLALYAAKLLFEKAGARLALTSRWTPPDREDWAQVSKQDSKVGRSIKTIMELEDAGAEVMIVVGDMGRYEDVSRMVSQVKDRWGRIHGVIHSAGAKAPQLIAQLTQDGLDKVFTGKVHGAFHLDRCLGESSMDFFVHFSSQATYSPEPGQSSYAVANGVLDSLARRRSVEKNGLNCSVGWGAWEEIGMAVDLPSQKVRSTEVPSGEGKVVDVEAVDLPMFQTCRRYDDGSTSYHVFLKEGDCKAPDWVLEHKYDDRTLVAGMAIVECIRSAYEHHADTEGLVELSQVAFMRPLFVDSDGTDVEIRFIPAGRKENFEVRARSRTPGSEWHCTSKGTCHPGSPQPETLISPPVEHFDAGVPPRHKHKHVSAGRRWRCRTGRLKLDDHVWNEITLPEDYLSDLDDFKLHPALLDMGIGSCHEDVLPAAIPFVIGTMRIYRPLSARFYSRSSYRRVGQTPLFHIHLVDEEGHVLLEAENYECCEVKGGNLADQVGHAAPSVQDGESPSAVKAALTRMGDIESFELQPMDIPEPAPDEVVIETRAASLNFRDVLTALGQMEDAVGESPTLGGECSGIVCSVGADVTAFKPGDPVAAFARGSFASHVAAKASQTILVTKNISMEDAAAIPIVFLTADHALKELGRLKAGERVLIHAAAGGVGLAAVQIAQQIGAEIYATVGRQEKRDYLSTLGVENIFDSRSLSFAQDILDATDGEGVDMVLNSLAGEFISAGLSILRPYGRFIEIGKRDLYANTKMGLSPFQNNLSYAALDLGKMLIDDHPVIPELFDDVMCRFATNELVPIPTEIIPIESISAGFKRMARAEHIGKIVFKIGDEQDAWRSVLHEFRERFRIGISPEAGYEALRRILACDALPANVLATGNKFGDARLDARPGISSGGSKARPNFDVPYCAADKDEEEKLVGIWEKLLGYMPIGVDDDYFDLGGDSITAIQVQYSVNELFGVRLPTSVLFDHPTIRELAELIREE